MKKICLLILISLLSVEACSQVWILRRTLADYYNYEPITGLAITAENGINVKNETLITKIIKSPLSTRFPINGWTYVKRYDHSPYNLSDSLLVADSTNGVVRTFDVSMYPVGARFEYRYSLLQLNANGSLAFKTDTTIIYNVEELPGHPLYTLDGYPVYDANGILLYPAIE
jgi:hypothetical protein